MTSERDDDLPKNWEWCPGMDGWLPGPGAWTGGFTVLNTDDGELDVVAVHEPNYHVRNSCDGTDFAGALPNWDSDGTKGAATGLMRRLWGDPKMHVMPASDGRWYAWAGKSAEANVRYIASGDSEADAIRAAIEAAPNAKVVLP